MGKQNNDIIKFRLYGDNISPSSFRTKDVAEILISFEDSLKSILKDIDPNIKEEDAFISLIEIDDESLGLKFKTQLLAIITAFNMIGSSFYNKNFDNLPTKALFNLREIQSKVRKYNCNSQFIINNKVIGELDANVKINISENQKISGGTTIYGKVIRVGGVVPRLRFQLIEGYPITIKINENLAKEIGKNIYSIISLNGSAIWNRKDNHILDFKIEKIGKYQETSIVDSFNELRNMIGSYWDNIDNIEEKLLNG